MKKLKKRTKILIWAGIILLVLIMILLIWGFIGAQNVGTIEICDIGIGEDFLCWKWHKGNTWEVLKKLGAIH